MTRPLLLVGLLVDQVREVRIVVADELADLFLRSKLGYSLEGPGSREDAGVFDRNLGLEVAEVGPPVALDHMQLIGVRVRILIQPHLVGEIDAIDDERVAVPTSDGIAVPQEIRLFRMLTSEIDLVKPWTVIVGHFDHDVPGLHELDEWTAT